MANILLFDKAFQSFNIPPARSSVKVNEVFGKTYLNLTLSFIRELLASILR